MSSTGEASLRASWLRVAIPLALGAILRRMSVNHHAARACEFSDLLE